MSELLPLIKHVHVWCVTLSFLFFITRLHWIRRSSPMRSKRWVKILPHVIDTLLLLSGMSMALTLHYSLHSLSWFSLKMLCVFFYIVTGILAFKLSRFRLPLALIALTLFISAAILAIAKPVLL